MVSLCGMYVYVYIYVCVFMYLCVLCVWEEAQTVTFDNKQNLSHSISNENVDVSTSSDKAVVMSDSISNKSKSLPTDTSKSESMTCRICGV